jgi:hypothetical protein
MSTVPENSTGNFIAGIPVVALHLRTPVPKRWTRDEFYRLGEQWWFYDRRVELIDGEIFLLSPQSTSTRTGPRGLSPA